MALYAFDGTWNDNRGDPTQGTNVVRFLDFYGLATGGDTLQLPSDDEEYIPGVGTRMGTAGKILGGFNGAGGRKRVRAFIDRFRENWRAGNRDVDVVGFSRGAALALHFCNALADGVEVDGEKVAPKIRFVGLWDTVPAFGLPGVFIDAFNDINIGWKLDLPRNVGNCFHAMALDEDRQAFRIHRPERKDPATALTELWFRGVHSDVGGGNGRFGLSSIALHWMLERAAECGLPVDRAKTETLKASFEPDAEPFDNSFGGEKDRRRMRAGDSAHALAVRVLAPGESMEIRVDSKLKFNVTPILVTPGASYAIITDPESRWVDKNISCSPAGWPDDLPKDKPGIVDNIAWATLHSYVFSNFRRVRSANWFELVACLDFDLKTAVPAGKNQFTATTPWSPGHSGRLSLFANDAESKYDNNDGVLSVRITRVS